MFEVKVRSATARSGVLSGDDWKLTTPNILYLSSQRFHPPDFAEAVLSGAEDDKPVIKIKDHELPVPCYTGIPTGLVPDRCDVQNIRTEGKVTVIRPEITEEELSRVRETELIVLENALELYKNPRRFSETIIKIKGSGGYQRALYLPGIAVPNNLAVLTYLGADLLDATRVLTLTRNGTFLTSDGGWPVTDVDFEGCICHGCEGEGTRYEKLLKHNLRVLHSELCQVRMRIAKNNFREFVEYRAKTSPELVSLIRLMDKEHYGYQEQRFPVTASTFRATTRLALGRPDVERFRIRLQVRYRKPPTPDTLLLLPCSARKPYSASKSHRRFRNAVRESGAATMVHEVIITSPIGLVPRELELFYPAQHYDIPVTGHWYEDESKMVNLLLNEYLATNQYENIIVHMGDEWEMLDGIKGAHITCKESPTSEKSLKSLTKELSGLVDREVRSDWKKRTLEEMSSIARFQFGEAAGDIFEECTVRGRYPNLRIFRGKEQLAMLSEKNGLLIPTLEFGKALAEREIYWVRMFDFELKGNLFSVGVEAASPEIRVGDEICIVSDKGLTATGTAKMNAEEMVESNKGEAVRVRHKVRVK